jgi:hypothetical protein
MPPILLKTSSLSRLYPSRAFYDSGGDSMSVGVKQKGKFGACLEGDEFSFDLTKDGKLLNIDVWKPRKDWTVEKAIQPPENFDRENVTFVGTRLQAEPISYNTDAKKSLLYMRFAAERIARFVSPANSLIFELNAKHQLVGLWILQIEDDINFTKEAEWRRSVQAV